MPAVALRGLSFRQSRPWILLLIVLLAALRLAHIHLLWADEDYHLAAAVHLLDGKLPYRGFWYDKPPLNAFYYLLIGGYPGWPLRLLDTAYVLLACWLAFRVGRRWWGVAEGWAAATLLAFYFAFYLPSAVIAFAADALMLVPHLAAIDSLLARRPLLAGWWCAVAFGCNAKALFLLLTCFLWLPSGLARLALGFAAPLIGATLLALASGTAAGYVDQVWRWGLRYAQGSPVEHPLLVGLRRTADWLGFHAALLAGTALTFVRAPRGEAWRLGSWLVLAFAGVALGTRFAPHYYLQLLPPAVVAGARGLVLAWRGGQRKLLCVAALLLVVPFVRFGPRYAALTFDNLAGRSPAWSDVALDLDSRAAAALVSARAHPGDTLFVWGYRPDIYVYTHLSADGLFWDSQPLTGVPADRHLHAEAAIDSAGAQANRLRFAQTAPTFLVDGLSPINPRLRPDRYPELGAWFRHYRLVGRTKLSLVYVRTK